MENFTASAQDLKQALARHISSEVHKQIEPKMDSWAVAASLAVGGKTFGSLASTEVNDLRQSQLPTHKSGKGQTK